MKRILLSVLCLSLFSLSFIEAQEIKTLSLEAFSKINLEGNFELHLVRGSRANVKIETKRAEDFEDLEIAVRNDELIFNYQKDENETPKFIIYLEHAGIEEVEMSGLVSLFSESILDGNFMLKGSGIVKGEIDVTVENLKIDTEGITNMKISGTADSAEININGLGKINAKKLDARSIKQRSDGFAKVKVGS